AVVTGQRAPGRCGGGGGEGQLHRLLRGTELDPFPGLIGLVGGAHDRVAGSTELMALGAPFREVLHVVLVGGHPTLGETLDPVAAGRCGPDASGGEQADQRVAATLLGSYRQALLDQLAHVLEGLVDAVVGGVRSRPQVSARALLAGVESRPEFIAALGSLLDEERGVVDVEPGDDAPEEAVGP